MAYLTEQRIVAPGYSSLQDLTSQALTYEQERLSTLVGHQLTEEARLAVTDLLADAPGLYEITLLKQKPKDFSLGEIRREIERGEQLRALYRLAKQVLPALAISNESIKYYASLVTYYSVFQLKQLAQPRVCVYLLCFGYHRYQRLNDNLLKYLIYKIREYVDDAKNVAKERVYAYRVERNQNLQKAGQVLKLFTDDTIAEASLQRKPWGRGGGSLTKSQKESHWFDQWTVSALSVTGVKSLLGGLMRHQTRRDNEPDVSKLIPLEVGLQISCGVRPETTAAGFVWRLAPCVGPDLSRISSPEGMPDQRRALAAGSCAYGAGDPAQVCRLVSDRFSEGQECRCHRSVARQRTQFQR
jgi:hypothetical protein